MAGVPPPFPSKSLKHMINQKPGDSSARMGTTLCCLDPQRLGQGLVHTYPGQEPSLRDKTQLWKARPMHLPQASTATARMVFQTTSGPASQSQAACLSNHQPSQEQMTRQLPAQSSLSTKPLTCPPTQPCP